ncbi:MAG: ABC transporter ATP-binding protein, partial [Paracoccus sp. (in: a-proteobacteria)]|nr:ABC transporter ATP-binding protein [Paracoccus sp. (in: a-proteobacteria)]
LRNENVTILPYALSMSAISIQNVSLRFGETRAVDHLSALFPAGGFAALLGPSGCGKTTLLRLIAGLERPDSGEILLDGAVVAAGRHFVGPERRNLGMVFQSYALWPHMSVAGNVGFALSRLSRTQRDERVRAALDMVGLTPMATRRPHELSGGQRQRVALARSLAARPRILLLDEPLANLDTHLRQSMLSEFRRIHAATGCTMIMVTHDQNEAMAVADLVAVMDGGRLRQFASPNELFERPANEMVARFIGDGRTVPVQVVTRDGERCAIRIGSHQIVLPGTADPGPAWLCLHARDLVVVDDGFGAHVVASRFADGWHVADVLLDDLLEAAPLAVRLERRAEPGEQLTVAIRGGWVLPRADIETGRPGRAGRQTSTSTTPENAPV